MVAGVSDTSPLSSLSATRIATLSAAALAEAPPSEFAKLTRIPIQLVWGDHIDGSPGWQQFYETAEKFAKAVNDRGGHVEIMRLTDAGLHGNSHIPFADMNNDQVAKLLFAWLKKNGF